MMIDSLTIKQDLSWVPCLSYDDKQKWIYLSELSNKSGIHRTTLMHSMKLSKRKIKNRWYIKLGSFVKYILEYYRYKELHTMTGLWWSKKEIELLYNSNMTIKESSNKLKRSYGSVKVMRSKLGIPRIESKFKNPAFISPHAVNRYKERIANIPAKAIIWNIQDGTTRAIFQEKSNFKGETYLCKGRYKLLDFRMIVLQNKKAEWPTIVTILKATNV